MQCEEFYMCDDPMGAFLEAILNYHYHYQDIRTSEWCKFNPKVGHNYYVCSELELLLPLLRSLSTDRKINF